MWYSLSLSDALKRILLGGGENQSVSGVTTICLMQCNTSPSHRVGQVVDCGLWNVGPLLYNGCAKLLDIGRNWNTLSALYSESRDSSVKWTPLQSARRHRMWAFAHSSRLRQRFAVRLRPRWGRRACRWAFLRRFLTVCAEILWLCKPIVAAAVWVAGLRRSWRWTCWMWRSWAGVVTCGLQLWGRLDVLPNSLRRLWRWLMVEKWISNSRATALVDIPAVSMAITRSLITYDICGIVLCDKTAHFSVAFYCGQPKAHLCNNHAV